MAGKDSTEYGWVSDAADTLFSWAVLMPIAVIVSGKLLAKTIKFSADTEQSFKISIKLLKIQATGGEVILGFAGFFITLFCFGTFGGKEIYELVKVNYGIDPGHFNSLCMFSSFTTVIWSSLVFLIYYLFSQSSASAFSPNDKEHTKLLENLAKKNTEGK
jgi:hypothetical protein